MPPMGRRRLLFGLGTLVLGGSGFALSGAVAVDSVGSRGSGWVPLEDPDIGDLEESPDETDEHDPEGEVRVQIVTDPFGGGENLVSFIPSPPRVVASGSLRSDGHGFLQGIHLDELNTNAITSVGRPQGDGSAFLIANVGGIRNPPRGGQAVDVSIAVYDNNDTLMPPDGAFTFPWQSDEASGDDLRADATRLPPGQAIGVAISVDGTGDRSGLETVSRIEVTVERA